MEKNAYRAHTHARTHTQLAHPSRTHPRKLTHIHPPVRIQATDRFGADRENRSIVYETVIAPVLVRVRQNGVQDFGEDKVLHALANLEAALEEVDGARVCCHACARASVCVCEGVGGASNVCVEFLFSGSMSRTLTRALTHSLTLIPTHISRCGARRPAHSRVHCAAGRSDIQSREREQLPVHCILVFPSVISYTTPVVMRNGAEANLTQGRGNSRTRP